MPYAEHPSAGDLPPEDTVIWRFMNLAKFLSLITKSSLHFAQASLLKMADPFEGSLGLPNRVFREKLLSDEEFARVFFQIPPDQKLPANLGDVFSVGHTRRMNDIFRATVYINCWHTRDHETAFLWSNYASNIDGVAVKSTVGRLRASISEVKRPIYIGPVRYIDYQTEAIQENNAFNPYFLKRKSFEPEQELRAVFHHLLDGVGWSERALEDNPPGVLIPCNLTDLVEEIVVSPLTPDWYLELVSETLSAIGVQLHVTRSTIADPAIF
ncbi:MAG: hypothetical protein IID50_10570 [Proteobacteria bacterium]|nr:hypothetical protein [Pseudomonadota bacterium]